MSSSAASRSRCRRRPRRTECSRRAWVRGSTSRWRSGGHANAQGDAGVIRPERADTYFEADIAATCERHEFGQQALRQPFLIVEILSASTERHDRRVKLPVYRQIQTVQEIALIASDEIYAEVHWRAGPQWITEILRSGHSVLSLTSIPIEIRLSDLCEGIALADAESGSSAEA